MKISFVIPAYNEEVLLAECLRAIARAIESSGCDAEVIVVNNASTDRTKEIASSFSGVRVIGEARKGLPYARQAGFEASSGELVANIDADTCITERWIPTVLESFSKNPRLVGMSGPFIFYDLPSYDRVLVDAFYRMGYGMHLLNQYVLRVGGMLQGGNFVVRRDALQKIGGFDTSIEFYGEDTDTGRRLSKVGRVYWSFKISALSSGRRMQKEGVVRGGLRYALNYLVTTYRGKPMYYTHTDVRPAAKTAGAEGARK